MTLGKIPSVTEIALVTERGKLDDLEVPADMDAAVVVRRLGETVVVVSVEMLRDIVTRYDAWRQ